MMLPGLLVLFACQLVGEAVVRGLGLPVPGPLLGMALLFVVLVARGGVPERIGVAADGILANMGLLFIPAGVGVVAFAATLKEVWPAVLIAAVPATLAGAAVTAWVAHRLLPAEIEDVRKEDEP